MIDETDKMILKEYQIDATVSYSTLAKRLGLPTSTVFNRIKRMRDSGVILGIVPLVNPASVGKTTTAWIKLGVKIDADCCDFAEEVARNPKVMEVYEIVGDYDVLVKIKVEDNEAVHDLTKELENVSGVGRMSSIIALKTVKEDPRIHID
jgi:DNA-binding Lrp family transcriptional regulator